MPSSHDLGSKRRQQEYDHANEANGCDAKDPIFAASVFVADLFGLRFRVRRVVWVHLGYSPERLFDRLFVDHHLSLPSNEFIWDGRG